MAALAEGREEEPLAQLRALLFLPSAAASPAPAATPAVKVDSAAGRRQSLAAIVGSTGTGGGRGSGPAAAAAAASSSSAGMAGRRRRRRRRQGDGSSKRDRDDDDSDAKDEQHDEDDEAPASAGDAHARPQHPPRCKRRKKKQQSSKSIVTSVPDFDGYLWRKYGLKQIEGAMYPRSYYRCTRSAEQGCQAKRTVQRNDDDGGAAAAAPNPEYTVVYLAEHTCTADDSLEAPVIFETTTAVAPAASTTRTANRGSPQDDDNTYSTDSSIVVPINTSSSSTGSCSTSTTTTTTTGTESPAISGDDVTCWSSGGGTGSSDYNYTDDHYCGGSLFAAAHVVDGCTTGPAADSTSSLQEMEDLTGPIRSPVHVPAPGCWTIDQLLLQLVNEPGLLCHF